MAGELQVYREICVLGGLWEVIVCCVGVVGAGLAWLGFLYLVS